MTSYIHYRKNGFFVANTRFSTLMEFVLHVGRETAASDDERTFLDRFEHEAESFWNGITLDLDSQFPSLDQKKFWATCFFDVGRQIFLRKLGNQAITFWQSSAICDAHRIAQMLSEAVCESEPGWSAATADSAEARRHYENLPSGR